MAGRSRKSVSTAEGDKDAGNEGPHLREPSSVTTGELRERQMHVLNASLLSGFNPVGVGGRLEQGNLGKAKHYQEKPRDNPEASKLTLADKAGFSENSPLTMQPIKGNNSTKGNDHGSFSG